MRSLLHLNLTNLKRNYFLKIKYVVIFSIVRYNHDVRIAANLTANRIADYLGLVIDLKR